MPGPNTIRLFLPYVPYWLVYLSFLSMELGFCPTSSILSLAAFFSFWGKYSANKVDPQLPIAKSDSNPLRSVFDLGALVTHRRSHLLKL